ncbi:MAG TPA: hypothetical protein VIZ65_00935 [Cellvibrionaceae bacterium]
MSTFNILQPETQTIFLLKFRSYRLLPWFISLAIVAIFTWLVLILQIATDKPTDEVTVRKIETIATLPPPPPPPPPELKTTKPQSAAPSISLINLGEGTGPGMVYKENSKMAINAMEQVQKPKFNKESLDIENNLSMSFPLHTVEELDSVPRLLSSNHISFPRRMRESGIDKVATKVEIIIDAKGKAYVKKIVDPVYPEMVEVIRKAINDSRFTVPTKNGRPVQAVYLYNLTFINRI